MRFSFLNKKNLKKKTFLTSTETGRRWIRWRRRWGPVWRCCPAVGARSASRAASGWRPWGRPSGGRWARSASAAARRAWRPCRRCCRRRSGSRYFSTRWIFLPYRMFRNYRCIEYRGLTDSCSLHLHPLLVVHSTPLWPKLNLKRHRLPVYNFSVRP